MPRPTPSTWTWADLIGGPGRVGLVIGMLVVFFAIPFGRQVLHISRLPALEWRMYDGKSLDVCLLDVHDPRTGAAVDWQAEMPPQTRLFPLTPAVRRGRDGQRLLRRLCAAHPAGLAVHLRCADLRLGFRDVVHSDEACAALSPEGRRGGPRRSVR